jgi:Uma2 family endonuclease
MASIPLPNLLPYQPIRMSVERYRELVRAGAFQEHDNVELLDGVVVEKMSKNPPHRVATRRCDLALSRLVRSGWHVQNQEPITLGTSEPEPDVAVIRGRLEDYLLRHPIAEEIALVVEVADTSLVTDRFKASLYANANIPVYWIINLNEQVVEVMQDPIPRMSPSQYASTRLFKRVQRNSTHFLGGTSFNSIQLI